MGSLTVQKLLKAATGPNGSSFMRQSRMGIRGGTVGSKLPNADATLAGHECGATADRVLDQS
ncbi:hypothetical protein [Mesorhizobium japonicum]|nr:hypothetical protein [Mesorhizobium japonicum]